MITAKKIVEEYYPDIENNRMYEVEDIRDYMYLKNNKRHYIARYFQLYKNGKEITEEQAKIYFAMRAVG